VVTAPAPAPRLDKVLEMDEVMRSARLAAGVHLDLGGVAKGWAAHQAVRRLQSYAPALVDAGGDIAVSGPRRDGSPWIIGIANPFDSQSNLGVLSITDGGVATSGRDYRRWRQGTSWQHHLIDPRTGLPAETDILSVTVTAPTVMAAETAAKTALILGSQVGVAWLNHQPGLEGLVVLENGQRLHSQNFQNLFLETL
jgi:FAD:protein FMN transferase